MTELSREQGLANTSQVEIERANAFGRGRDAGAVQL